jgi:sulfatase modifying factor 1
MKRTLVVSITIFAFMSSLASAELIRDGIDMEFVTIGNAGNAADTGGTPGCGAVAYNYRIGKYEVTNAQWNAFTAAVGAPTGSDVGYSYSSYYTGAQQPTNQVNWYEAAQFCNYLTTGDKSTGAYQFSGNNANPGSFLGIDRVAAQKAPYSNGTVYVIPTEDEWYKAAYFKPNGRGYSRYANGLNTIPAADNGWNYYGGTYSTPWNIGTGSQEQNGTFDMMGNVWEWNETLFYDSYRGRRGSSYGNSVYDLSSSNRIYDVPYSEISIFGFRVASIVPEPASAILMLLGAAWMGVKRKRQAGL